MEEYLLEKEVSDFIFDILLKDFKEFYTNSEEAKDTLRMHGPKLQNYLGMYFPRSFVEAREICRDLLSVQIINKTFKNKENINILDIGSGTGGNLMGLLCCLEDKGILDNKEVKIVSIDGNKEALEYQEKMRIELFPRVSLRPEKKEFEDKENFEKQINKIVSGNKFDIIMSFQFVNEFYRKKYGEFRGLYRTMAELAYKCLRKDGLFILSDCNGCN